MSLFLPLLQFSLASSSPSSCHPSVSTLRAPEPRAGAGEEGRPVAVGRSGDHVRGRAAV